MFVGFVKSIPLEIEEAAAIDGCSPLRTYFSVVFPMLRPTMISVGIWRLCGSGTTICCPTWCWIVPSI